MQVRGFANGNWLHDEGRKEYLLREGGGVVTYAAELEET